MARLQRRSLKAPDEMRPVGRGTLEIMDSASYRLDSLGPRELKGVPGSTELFAVAAAD